MLVVVVVAILLCVAGGGIFSSKSSNGSSTAETSPHTYTKEIICPTCGSPAVAHGKNWECSWCGDCGRLRD